MRFSGFDDEWNEVKLGDISTFLDNKRIPLKEDDRKQIKGEYPYYGASGIIDYVNDYIFDEELILMGEDGANIVTRSSKLIFLAKGKYWVNNHAYVIKADNNINQYFLSESLERINYEKYNTGTAQPKLNREVCQKIKVKIPQFNEQNKIANFLLVIDEKLRLLEQKYQYYQNFKKYLMQQIFTQKLRFNFNDTWKTVKIKDIFDERSEKGFLDLELLSVTLNDGVIKRSEIESKDNSNENKSNYKHVLPGDIVYNSMRMWQGASGVSPYEGIVSPAYTILIPKNVYSKYFGYYFKTNEMVYQFKKYSQGLTSDTWNLKYPLISEIKIKIPSIEEQKEITNVFEIMDEKIKILQNNIDELTTFKKGLLQQMFVVRINWRCNFKLAKSPSFNKHLLILKNKIIFIIIK